ncbi:CAP domain-containing protein [Pontivivens nitratireducens]|uniref:SCP domain-containing protein n=1 Tax=Pontivivens nitratireducens TaxID=2758038 RepID=A0A6G7VMA3_9RHOB|nr:CAP domain-containing protein [Pontibrevibacter nitratireducens]QIK40978.1 hypothetical protein G8E03_09470 [Pontibrevibacter nitratireducens]
MLKTLTLLAALALPGAVLACPAQPLPDGAQADLPRDGSHDTALFSLALAHHVNVERCAEGLSPIAPIPGLNAAAAAHSRDMAQYDFFDHVSPVEGRETLTDRLSVTGVSLSRIAENLGQTFVVDYEPGREYRVVDAENCEFTYNFGSGVTDKLGSVVGRRAELLDYRTYDSAAQAIVAGWMASPPHRRNMLDPAFTRHGAGFAITDADTLCGRILATQVLIK